MLAKPILGHARIILIAGGVEVSEPNSEAKLIGMGMAEDSVIGRQAQDSLK